ncbi:DUF397 domain-containing protein [Streptomyces sp. I05A-00742]|uniref:DUF397 domain-containing protein n=1 Tax=Streptomyces sp. I05A-00742 TaxID=2732853 RepID=UPI001488AF4C|nr:DUF397 domain-containing protein [Streptomyces sp. I05A-00742]
MTSADLAVIPKLPAQWHTSSYSGRDNNCLEHTTLSTSVHAVRDTKDPDRRTTLTFTAATWQAFVDVIATSHTTPGEAFPR